MSTGFVNKRKLTHHRSNFCLKFSIFCRGFVCVYVFMYMYMFFSVHRECISLLFFSEILFVVIWIKKNRDIDTELRRKSTKDKQMKTKRRGRLEYKLKINITPRNTYLLPSSRLDNITCWSSVLTNYLLYTLEMYNSSCALLILTETLAISMDGVLYLQQWRMCDTLTKWFC